jgi:hypothetical protein
VTDIILHIKLPSFNFSLPRKQAKVLGMGILIGIFAAFLVVDLSSGSSRILGVSSKIWGTLERSFSSKKPVKKQEDKFKYTFAIPEDSLKALYHPSILFAQGCSSCENRAIKISEMINGNSGWRVLSFGGQFDAHPRSGLTIEIVKNNPSSAKGVAALETIFKTAGVSYKIEEAPDLQSDAEFAVFVGPDPADLTQAPVSEPSSASASSPVQASTPAPKGK